MIKQPQENDQQTKGKGSTNHRKRINQTQEKDQPTNGKGSTKHRERINQPQEKDQLTTGKRSSIHTVVFTVAMNMKTILYPVSSLHTKKVNRTSFGDNGRTITIQTLIFLFRAEPSRQ